MPRFSRSNPSTREFFKGQHRFEHWYRDNTIYFITARVRDRVHAFTSNEAKAIFWDRFGHYTCQHDFQPFVTALMVNHYHFMGYLGEGKQLKELMRKLHGSVAKLVNDLLPVRIVPFWADRENRDYFDGCLRDDTQFRRTYRYVLHQLGAPDPNIRVNVSMEDGLKFAIQQKCFLPEVPYRRYERKPLRDSGT